MKLYDASRYLALVIAILAAPACGDDSETRDMARPNQIRAAAERCGLQGFDGNSAGAYWDANVPHSVENWVVIEDCIYADLESDGLRATRFMNIYEWDEARIASGCQRDPASGACTR